MKSTALLLPCVLVLLLSIHATATQTLLFAQVAHRHGARTPSVSANESKICGPQGCGALIKEGKDMLRKIGAFARQRYVMNSSTAYIPQVHYDSYKFYSRSTDVDRTLQSSDGFLKGLFNNESIFPVVHTVEKMTDVLLIVDALPSFTVPHYINQATITKQFAAMIPQSLKQETVRQMAAELSLDQLCEQDVVSCVLEMQDVACYLNAIGTLPNYKVTFGNFVILRYLLGQYNSLLYPYDKNSPMDVQRGSLGQNLAQELINGMYDVLKGKQQFYFREFSAHDTTLIPLTTTLGQNTMLKPVYAESYFFELWFDNETFTPIVKILIAVPEQTPGDHHLTVTPFPMMCMNGDRTTYPAPNGCPLRDFANFVASSAAASDIGGDCYLDAAVKQTIGYDTPSGTAPWGGLLQFYREHCLAWACPQGSYLIARNWTCAKIGANCDTTSSIGWPTGHALSVCIASVFGILLGFAIAHIMIRRPREEMPPFHLMQSVQKI